MTFPMFLAVLPCLMALLFAYWKSGFTLEGEPIGIVNFFEGLVWGLLLSMILAIVHTLSSTLIFFIS